MARMDGKVALISGGSRGQGEAEARLFAKEGAKVVLGDILDHEGMKVEADINKAGGSAKYVHLDVTNEADWAAAVRVVVDMYGKLDILINYAGIVLRKSIEDASGDNIKSSNTEGIIFNNIKSGWTGRVNEENGAYAIYPVLSKNVIIEKCEAFGASDAGIYVGQSENVIIRDNKTYWNVAGIESENSSNVEIDIYL